MIPVAPENYHKFLPLLEEARINVYFAKAVLLGHVKGTVLTEDVPDPSVVYVRHSYGMSVLCGEPRTSAFRDAIFAHLLNESGERKSLELLQASPASWHTEIRTALGDRLLRFENRPDEKLDPAQKQAMENGKVVEWGRLNYRFDRSDFEKLELPPLPEGYRVQRVGLEAYSPWQGSVIPRFFWNTPEDFQNHGVGFGVYEDGELKCIAFSSWILEGVLELGIETAASARKQGLATHACAALIRHSLELGLEPVWSTRHDNYGSQALAERLGFRRTLQVPYYRLVQKH
jgi:RimJ/RimL family protein N-acetyltransferase